MKGNVETMSAATQPYDALLLVSFGGPEKPDDVLPFLQNVTRGRAIPDERLVEVGAHYYGFGGRSPINDQCRELKAAIETDLAANGIDLPVYWGNRNWDPYLPDTLRAMAADGVQRAVYFVTAAYASYSGCRQYRENLAAAVATVGDDAPKLHRLPHYFDRPGFIEPFVDATLAALGELPTGARMVFVTHSIPTAMNDASGAGGAYVAQHHTVARAVAGEVARRTGGSAAYDLVYCSRSGPPSQPWLEPDVGDHLEQLAASGTPGAAVIPIGFVSDHMEVIYDLDTEAKDVAARVGLPFARAATPGIDPRFVSMVRELVLERASAERGQQIAPALRGTQDGPPAYCQQTCCPNPRAALAAL
ncbi:ferrochelatase [Promicromonospora xylanilytica]